MNTRNRPSTKVFFGLVVSIVVPTLSGCGGGSSTPLTVDDFCTQKAAQECQVAGLCAVLAPACETVRKAACMSFVATANVPPRVFVPGNVAACVNKTKSVYAESLIKPADLDGVADVCNYVFQGPAAELTACTTKYDCKNQKDLCDKGECATQTNVAAGAQCANFGAVCPAAQYCNTVGAAMMCVAKGALGAACSAATPCDGTKMLTCTAGMCAMQVASGDTCTTDADCLAAAPYCNPYAGNKCGTGLTFSAGSASCSAFGGTASATGTAGAAGGTAGAGGGSDGAAGATGGTDAGGSDASTTDAGDAATTG
jgi:hypothetical protein